MCYATVDSRSASTRRPERPRSDYEAGKQDRGERFSAIVRRQVGGSRGRQKSCATFATRRYYRAADFAHSPATCLVLTLSRLKTLIKAIWMSRAASAGS